MAYIFQENELPKLVSTIPGRERTLFVNKQLAKTDDMLAGIMCYAEGASSPWHLHEGCEHFYFIIEGDGTVESEEGARDVGCGDMIFIPAGEKHRVRASKTPLLFFELQAPNRSLTTVLDGKPEDFGWNRIEGRVTVQTEKQSGSGG